MQFKFNEDAESVATSEFHYDLFTGGYVRPERLLVDQAQVDALYEAIALINEFESQLEAAGLLEEM